MCAALYMSVITPLSSSMQSYTPLHIWLVVVLPGCCCTIVPGSTPSMCTLVLCLNGLWIGISCRPMQLMLLIVVEWEWPVVQSITLFFTKLPHFAPTNSPPIHPLPPSNPGLSSLDAVEQSNFQRYMCSKLLLVHGVWLSLYWSFSHTQFAQVLVPFLVKTRFEQQSIFFLPSYSSSVFLFH